ncbi:MAG: N-acetylneuraminate synthase family protein [Syntrophales bacterium]
MGKSKINFCGRTVGDDEPIFMIAEIGLNHNGEVGIAKKLIDAAFACNWDCVKFQKRTPDICVPEHQKSVSRDTPWGRMTYLEYRRRIEFGEKEYSYIDHYCQEKPILWTASVWDLPSLQFMLRYDVPFIKIPSAKLVDADLLRAAATTGKPLVVSTGMSTVEEIDAAVSLLNESAKGNYILMHTNSTYPTPPEELNLSTLKFLKERYDCVVGYSGHEYDLEPSVIAVALGASIVERHVTLDHNMWGSDQSASLEVHAMDLLRKRLKHVRTCLGDGVKRLTDSEIQLRKKLRG